MMYFLAIWPKLLCQCGMREGGRVHADEWFPWDVILHIQPWRFSKMYLGTLQ